MIEMRSHLWGVQQRMHEMKSTHSMTTAICVVPIALVRMNRQMNMPQIQKILREFAMESEKMEMTTEMVGGAIDDAMEDEMDEEETEAVVGQVLAEIGLDLSENIASAPTNIPAQQDKSAEKSSDVSELEARLENLRR